MAPFTYPGYRERQRDNSESWCFGHEYERLHHWQCYGCGKWFNNNMAHGCSYPEETKKKAEKKNMFLEEKRQKELRLAWKQAS